jgi:uncharacterized membrane protein
VVMDNSKWLAAQAEWENSANWRWGHYIAPRDPRVWVRKRNPQYGWTLNLAHRRSWMWLAVLLGVPVGMGIWRAL